MAIGGQQELASTVVLINDVRSLISKKKSDYFDTNG